MVIRRLQIDKLLDVYDAEVLTQQELGQSWRIGQCSPCYAFARVAPMRVMVEATYLLYNKLQDDGWVAPLHSVHDSTGALKRANANTTVYTDGKGTDTDHKFLRHKGKRAMLSLEVPSKSTEEQEGNDSDQFASKFSEETSGPSVKATKNDNAKVNKQQWDVWLVNNYHKETGERAQICVPGSYCKVKHGKLFGSLQALAICWYHCKILRSFLSYLWSQHADNGSYTDTVVIAGYPRQFNLSTWVKSRYKFKALVKPKGK